MEEKEKIKEIFEKFEKKHKDGIISIFGENDWVQWNELKSSIQKEFDELKNHYEATDSMLKTMQKAHFELEDKLKEKDKEIERLKERLENKSIDFLALKGNWDIDHEMLVNKLRDKDKQLQDLQENYQKDLSDAIAKAESLIFKDSIPRKRIEDRIIFWNKELIRLRKDKKERTFWR